MTFEGHSKNYATRRNVPGSSPDEVTEFFHLTKSLQPHHDPGIYSASNRTEHQMFFWGVKLTTSPPSVSQLCRQFEILSILQSCVPPRSGAAIALLYLLSFLHEI
jgi:hypothetical protein